MGSIYISLFHSIQQKEVTHEYIKRAITTHRKNYIRKESLWLPPVPIQNTVITTLECGRRVETTKEYNKMFGRFVVYEWKQVKVLFLRDYLNTI